MSWIFNVSLQIYSNTLATLKALNVDPREKFPTSRCRKEKSYVNHSLMRIIDLAVEKRFSPPRWKKWQIYSISILLFAASPQTTHVTTEDFSFPFSSCCQKKLKGKRISRFSPILPLAYARQMCSSSFLFTWWRKENERNFFFSFLSVSRFQLLFRKRQKRENTRKLIWN